jgi:hypothetical protein
MPNAQVAKPMLQRVALYHLMGRVIGDKLAPPWRVPSEEFSYMEWASEHLAEVDTTWQGGAIPSESTFRWASRTGRTQPHKHRVPLTTRDLRKADSQGGIGSDALRRARARVATGVIITGYEAEVVSLFTNTANYAAGHTVTKAGGAEWDQAAVADQTIVDDINAGIDKILNALTGYSAEDLTLSIPERVWRAAIRNNSVIRETVRTGKVSRVTEEMVRDYFGFGQVLIPTAAKLAGNVNVDKTYETESLTTHWLDNVWMGLVGNGETAGIEKDEGGMFAEQVLGYAATAYWPGDTGGQRRQVREYDDPDPGKEVTWMEVKEDRKVVVTNNKAGYLIKNTLTGI